MENNDNQILTEEMEKLAYRIVTSNRLTRNEILVLLQFGLTTGLFFLNNILKTIEEKGEIAAGKNFSQDIIEILLNAIDSEYYSRTFYFYVKGQGLQIPEELAFAHLNLSRVILDLESEMRYGNLKLKKDINQRELAYIFAAFSKAEIFYSSADLLADSLYRITKYSEESIRRVILEHKKSNGGWSDQEKKNLLKKISDIITLF